MTDESGIKIERFIYNYEGKPPIMDAIWMLISAYQILQSTKRIQSKLQSAIDKCQKNAQRVLQEKHIDLQSYDLVIRIINIDIWFDELLTKTVELIRKDTVDNAGIRKFVFGFNGEIVINDSLLGICRQSGKNGKLFIKFRHCQIPLEALESPINISNPTV